MQDNNTLKQLIGYFNIESELEDHDKVNDEIRKGVVFKGTNLWVLIFAIVVASVGLNMNSTAVIIGAMLISPLMGPINGMGYSIATYDFDLFKKSIKNFSFAIIVSLIASTTYFAISPVSTAYSELLARTSPTIYDVVIALFGGLAGIFAISSRLKGNVIPGVAIATALMPPLCTAGYGLATRQFGFFFGAFYLFTINTIFIAIASVWVSQILKFPIRTIVDVQKRKKINRLISLVITIVLIPSIYFGYILVKQERFTQHAHQYVSNVTTFEGNYLLKHTTNAKTKKIHLIYGGTPLSEDQKNNIIAKAKDFSLSDSEITIDQGMSYDLENNSDSQEITKLYHQIHTLTDALEAKQKQLDEIQSKTSVGKDIYEELRVMYPEVTSCLFSESCLYTDSRASSAKFPVLILSSREKIDPTKTDQLNRWLKKRLKNENAVLIYK